MAPRTAARRRRSARRPLTVDRKPPSPARSETSRAQRNCQRVHVLRRNRPRRHATVTDRQSCSCSAMRGPMSSGPSCSRCCRAARRAGRQNAATAVRRRRDLRREDRHPVARLSGTVREVEERLQPVPHWRRKDCWAQIFRELQIDIDARASIALWSARAPRDGRRSRVARPSIRRRVHRRHRLLPTRYDKTRTSFLALLQVACICLWLN